MKVYSKAGVKLILVMFLTGYEFDLVDEDEKSLSCPKQEQYSSGTREIVARIFCSDLSIPFCPGLSPWTCVPLQR